MTPDQKINKILRDNHLQIDFEISFPRFKTLPDEVKLALKIMEKYGMKISFILQEKSE